MNEARNDRVRSKRAAIERRQGLPQIWASTYTNKMMVRI